MTDTRADQVPRREWFLQAMYGLQFWLSGSECYYWVVRTYSHDGLETSNEWEWFSISAFTFIFIINAMKVIHEHPRSTRPSIGPGVGIVAERARRACACVCRVASIASFSAAAAR